ncbi:hypothetical protein SAMN05444411_10384 [Lutibacter oricola]|uniref:YdhG-like domain-containing protein n=1 Tax=Lutibacter oricola TaxID=762486 RepID=A0A1H2YWX0_9FLAO|nr:DUF1801 domain-containing protein [Lutibacter oricola]SDX09663.1 hypothetical protein SAMN05444411_10384 [Lutibacter oricola]
MNPIDEYLYSQKEPYQSIMLYVRSVIHKALPEVEEKFSYKIPFFMHCKKPMIYLNVLKGTNFVDIAFVQGILLEEKYTDLKNYNKRKQVRSIQVKSLENFNEPMFIQLVKDAAIFMENTDKAWFV